MIILGIDPGTALVGYALLKRERHSPILMDCGLMRIRSRNNLVRLEELHCSLMRLLKKWEPEVVAVERLFFTKNAKTAFSVSEARGVILLTTSLAGLKVYEYTPLEIKKTVTGDGRADKLQLRKMIRLLFKETEALNGPDDVFDAIAAALTCYYRLGPSAHPARRDNLRPFTKGL